MPECHLPVALSTESEGKDFSVISLFRNDSDAMITFQFLPHYSDQTTHCHFDPFDKAQGKLWEKSFRRSDRAGEF
jgi:hypothetical protein